MRKLWLNSKSWGDEEKDRENNLHHAADAIVIANLTPAYVEIASDAIKLQNIYKAHHKQESFEYTTYLNGAVKKMAKYYGFNEAYSRRLLEAKGRIPSIVRNLYAEVDKRLVDNSLEIFQAITPERFMANVKDYYRDDQAFAESLSMPLVSYKQNKKFQGQITDDNPIAKNKRKETSVAKIDTLGNENILSANKYYCIEIYKDNQNKTALRGIRYVDLVKRNKKLYLATPYPVGYQEHVMYLFANDYVRIYDGRNRLKFEGYYRSTKNVKEKRLYFRNNNSSSDIDKTIAQKDTIKKYNVDILGNLDGEVKCSEPFMLLPEK
jgi:CRISPR-associated endonuclease Csn1